MRHFISILLIATFPSAHADIVSDWLNKLESSAGPSQYHSGTRGYLSAGSIQASIPSTNEYLMSFSPPKINAGACGVDLFLGGFSFMDIQYLGDKLEAIWQNADAVALSMAMSALSKTLDEKGVDFTAITDFLNGLQFNECEIAKMGVTAVVDGGKWAYDKLFEEEAQAQATGEGFTDNTQDYKTTVAANDGETPAEVDISASLKACEQPIQDILGGSGSIIERITKAQGIVANENIIRGLIGDIYIEHTGAADAPQIAISPPCKENNINSIDDFIFGTAQAKARPTSLNINTTGSCTAGTYPGGLLQYNIMMLNQLSDHLKNPSANQSDTNALGKYVNSSPLPIYQIMKHSNDLGIEQNVISELSHVVSYSGAYSLIQELQKNTRAAFNTLNATLSAASVNTTTKATADTTSTVATKCDLAPYTGVITEIGLLERRLDFASTGLHERYLAKVDQLMKLTFITDRYSGLGKKTYSNLKGN